MSLQVLLVGFTEFTYKFYSLLCHSLRMSVCDAAALQMASLYRAGGALITPQFSPTQDRSKQSRQNCQDLFLSLGVKCNGENPSK